MSRKAGQQDINLYKKVIEHMGTMSYTKAIHAVAGLTDYSVKGVYGMVNRAKNDPAAVQQIVLALTPTIDDAGLCSRLQITPEQLQEYRGDSYAVRGVSALYRGDGSLVQQWVKYDKRAAWQEGINAALNRIERITPLPVGKEKHATSVPSERLTVYPVADLHLGLYAAQSETGQGWTLSQAAKAYLDAFWDIICDKDHMNENAVIANLGDFTHIDNVINRTPASGAAMDASGRYREVVETAMDVAVSLIELVRVHYRHVTVLWQSGNHDEATGIVMQAALKQLYKHNDAVTVVEPRSRFHVMQHGKVALGFTHGDTVKPDNLPLLMATDYAKIWGNTEYRVWHTGHVHHRTMQEHPGCVVETHGSPTAKDAWHYAQGYRSQRTVQRVVYDFNGELERQYKRII